MSFNKQDMSQQVKTFELNIVSLDYQKKIAVKKGFNPTNRRTLTVSFVNAEFLCIS